MNSRVNKKDVIQTFHDHVSSGKADFFKKYGMDFVMGRRDGPWLWDMDGQKRLYNLHCNGGVFNLGHRNPEVLAAVREALDQYDIGNHHLMSRFRAGLAGRIAELMPEDLHYTIFGVSGGEAVDTAFKIARGYTRRTKIISVRGGYHGHTGLALAAGDEKYRAPFGPLSPGFIQVPFGDAAALESVLDDDTAAVILETVPATLGIAIPTPEYLQKVRKLCTARDILLILDEVQTGLGRTGKLWAFEHFNIVPDIVVLGKGLSGGIYPITATVIREPLERVFNVDPFIHVSTFGGAEIGCAAAAKVLEISSRPEFLERVNSVAALFREELLKLQLRQASFFKGIRQLGLMIGLELKDEYCGPLLTKTAYDNGLLMVYANNDTSVCQCLPPLTMSPEDIDSVVKNLDKAMTQARRLKPLLKLKRAWSSLRSGAGKKK